MNQDDYYKAQIVQYCWFHSDHSNSLQGLEAVAFGICSRYDSGWSDWPGVFSTLDKYAGNLPVINPAPSPNDHTWMKLLAGIDSIFDGSRPDTMTTAKTITRTSEEGKLVRGLYWANLNLPLSNFFKTEILGNREAHHQIAVVGAGLTFFS